MKQHITVEQLNELSDKGREKLRVWWLPGKWGDYILLPNQKIATVFVGPMQLREALPLLSIGQMIEYLDEKDYDKMYIPGEMIVDSNVKELCDTLWEAVKSILTTK